MLLLYLLSAIAYLCLPGNIFYALNIPVPLPVFFWFKMVILRFIPTYLFSGFSCTIVFVKCTYFTIYINKGTNLIHLGIMLLEETQAFILSNYYMYMWNSQAKIDRWLLPLLVKSLIVCNHYTSCIMKLMIWHRSSARMKSTHKNK